MYTNIEIAKAFQLWRLSDFSKPPTLEESRKYIDLKFQDLELVKTLHEYLNKKGG